ncbi:uncharacterized protein [Ptychodera flava]|uniref:uncharacterized protein n=1 Tax=Ptychodera flava TaxID=63121 RepID=UPI00396AB12C
MAPSSLKGVLLASVCVCSILSVRSDFPFRNTSLPWDERVDDLVKRLTMDEIILQMARGGTAGNGPAPPIDRLGIGPYSWNTECLHGDSRAGLATSFPQSIGLAAAFDAGLVGEVANATAFEVRAKYNDFVKHKKYGDHKGLSCFSPVINIARHPLWGRNQETYGEDPFLTGALATTYVTGLQGSHPRYITANAGCKHFDVYAGPEDVPVSRFSFDAKVSERDWRMTFLPAFHECVKAGTYSLMCSYNSINGIPACANKKLLTDILRKEWKFTGYVISDESAVERTYQDHHYTKNMLETAIATVNSGLNLELSHALANNTFMRISEAVQQGSITMDTLIERVKPLFYTRMRLGEFDPAKMNPYAQLDLSILENPRHQEIALRSAEKTFVLLKNDKNYLPLGGKVDTLAVVGPFADSAEDLYGTYAPDVSNLTVTPRVGLSQLASSTKYASGCLSTRCLKYDSKTIEEAVTGADLVVACIGTGGDVESEGNDRTNISLPGQQLRLLQDTVKFANGKPVIVLLFNAGPLDVSWAVNNDAVPVIVACFFPAQSTGTALYNMFVNKPGANPAGRLPMTWPKSMEQVPPMVDYTMEGRTYRYFSGDPLYPFGYGLSYTTFQYSNLKVNPSSVEPCSEVMVSVNIQNTGSVAGDEVSQLYLSWNDATIEVPKWQLVAFNRTEIQSSKSIIVSFTISPRAMALYTDSWVIEPGTYTVYVGGQQPNQATKATSNVLKGQLHVTGAVTPLSQC